MPRQSFGRTDRPRPAARPCLALLVAAAALLAPGLLPTAAAATAPWQPGDRIAGWEVVELRSHEEFLRVYLQRDGVRTGAEIVRDEGGPDEFRSARFRVQPAPDAESPPDEDLLRALVPALSAWEAAGGATAGPAPTGAREPQGAGARAVTAGGLAGLLPLALLVLALGALVVLRARRRREKGPLVALGAALLLLVGVRLAPGSLFPTAWLTPLHEGGTQYLVEILHGHYPNTGPLFDAAKSLLVGTTTGLALPAVALANAALWGVWIGLFAAVARPALGWPGGIAAAALLLVVEPIGLHAAVSESPAALLGTLLCLGALAARWTLAADTPRRERVLGLVLCALLALAVVLVRVELLPVVGGALLTVGARLLVRRGGRLAALLDPPREGRWRRWLGPLALFCGVVLAVGALHWIHVSGEGPLGWALRAWKPGGKSWESALGLLAGTLPPATLALLLLGVAQGFRRPLASAALGLTVPFAYALYVAQWGWGYYVQFRYLVQAWPLLSLLVLAGARPVVARLRELANGGGGRRLAAAGLALLLAAATVGPRFAGLEITSLETRPPAPFTLLDRNKQRAARFLVDLFRRHPEAVLVTRASVPPHWKEDRGRSCAPLVFGPGRPDWLGSTAPPDAIPAALAAAPPDAVLCYRGLDANLRIRTDCEVPPPPPAAAAPVAEARWLSRPHVPRGYQGAEEALIHLAVFRCDPAPLLAPPAADPEPPPTTFTVPRPWDR